MKQIRLGLICGMIAIGGAAHGYAPCSMDRLACTRVTTEVDVRVALTSSRFGTSGGNYSIGGMYGDGVITETNNPTDYRTKMMIRSSESISTIASSRTNDGLVFANAQTSADLTTGRLRAKIEGFEALLPPQSLFEDSIATVTSTLQDTIYLKLPKNFSGGFATFQLTVEGHILDTRSFLGYATYAQAEIGTQSGVKLGQWNTVGPFIDLLSTSVSLPAIPGFEMPVALRSTLTLNSGSGAGGYDVNLFNTATISLVVPDGVTWRSASGLFLSAVPEPGNWQLFLLGAGLLLIVVRDTSRKRDA